MSQKLGFYHCILLLICTCTNLFGQLSADFEVIYKSQCPPGIINLVNKSTGFTTCHWVFGNGNSSESTLDTLNQVYPNSGNFTITLTVSDGVNQKSVSKNIIIFKEPKASFTTNIQEGCIPMQVTFTQAAIKGDAPITQYYWDFRNGTVIKDMNPTMNYSTVGQFDVLLRVTDSNGCSNFIEKEKFIKTYSQPNADFQANPPFACSVPAYISFSNQTSSQINLNYQWDFGNGQNSTRTNPVANYDKQNIYRVKLTASNESGCFDTISKEVVVQNFIKSSFTMSDISAGIVNNNDTVCKGQIILKNTTVPLNLSHWVVNGSVISYNNSQTYNFTFPGWNTIKLVPNDSGTCTNEVVKRIYVTGPTADFKISDIRCEFPLTVNFTNLSTGAESYQWDLAQGNSSTAKDPQIVLKDIYARKDYINAWPVYYYDNKLTVTDKFGCVDSVKKSISFVHPVARLTGDKVQGCVPLNVTFTDTSAAGQSIQSKSWLFDDGTSSGSDSIHNSHTYLKGGDYNARLVLENDHGCRDTSDAFVINAGEKLHPDFDYSPSTLCYDDSISFTDKTNRADVIDYWSYSSQANLFSVCEGDPDPKLAIDARSTGYYDLKLEVGYNGCISDTTFKNAIYINGPTASFIGLIDCNTPRTVNFKGTMDQATSYSWDFGDNTTPNTSNVNPQHIYAASGDYNVKLTAYNNISGCQYNKEDVVKIRQIKAALDFDSIACVGQSVHFDASGSVDYINECTLEGFQWDFGDGTAPRLTYMPTKDRAFNSKGTFPVRLIARDINGCSDTATKNIHISQPEPLMKVDSATGCTPSLTVRFQNVSTDTTISSYTWIFGDGQTLSDTNNVQHTYNSSLEKSFFSELFAQDIYGCPGYYGQWINLFKPDAAFGSDEQAICLGDTLLFNTTYANPDSSHWYYGNIAVPEKSNQHVFNDTGNFTVAHTIFKDHCVDSATIKNYISVEKASAKLVASDTVALCYPQTILFTHIKDGSPVVSGGWDFDFKGHTSPGYADSVSFSYSLPGEFYPSLRVYTKNGCTDKQNIKITVKGPYAEYAISDRYPCKGDSVNFHMTVDKDVYQQLWDFGDGRASIEKSPGYAYSSIDTFITSLTVSDINGCTPPAVYDTVFINQVRSDFVFPGNDSAFCVNDLLDPKNNSIGGSSYIWLVNGVQRSDQFEPSGMFLRDTGQYLLSLLIYNDHKCSDTSSKQFIVYPLPDVRASVTDTICRSLEKAVLSVNTDSGWTVEWSPDYFIDNVHGFSTTASPEYSTRYTVKVTDANGCVNSDSADVFVHQFPELTRNPENDTTVLLGEEVTLLVHSDKVSDFSWSTNKLTDQTNTDTVVVKPLENTVYTVNVKDVCFENEEEFPVNVRKIYTVVLPDVFTPNGDGINDRIYVRGGGIKELLEFKIFNRYGNLVYSSSDIHEGWDGYYKGKLQNPDVYMYVVKVLTYEDKEVTAKGSFNLVY